MAASSLPATGQAQEGALMSIHTLHPPSGPWQLGAATRPPQVSVSRP